MQEEREPDIDDDPRQQQQSGQGYPEENPADSDAGGPDSGTGGAEERSPDTDAGQDEPPSNATGNPGAAGG